MSLYHLIYQIQALVPFAAAELTALLQQSRSHNQQTHITDLLLHSPDSRFLQILESEDADVQQLYYQLIASDPRHYQYRVIGEGN